MNQIPVDMSRMGTVLVTGVEAATDQDGVQRTNAHQVPLWKLECLVRPPSRPDGTKVRASVEMINIPSPSSPKIPEMTPVVFDGLVARHWEMAGRSGLSFSADSARRQGGDQ